MRNKDAARCVEYCICSMILIMLSRCNSLKISSLKRMDLWLNVHYNYVTFQNCDLWSYEKWKLNNENHYVWCRFISKPCFLFYIHNFDCTVHDKCTLVLGEYVNWKAIENYFPVNYSKPVYILNNICVRFITIIIDRAVHQRSPLSRGQRCCKYCGVMVV